MVDTIPNKDMPNIILKRTILLACFLLVSILLGAFVLSGSFLKSVLFSAIVLLLTVNIFKFFIYPDVVQLSDKIKKLEEEAKRYNVGTRLLIRRDLELNRANEKLKELDEIKSNFISVVAHQLRTPLSGVKWTLDMILSGDMGELNNDQKTFLMKSYESNNRMITLVNDMLNADRIQSGKTHYGFRYINIVDLLDSVLFEVSPQATKRNITIEFKKKLDNIPQAYIDSETMRAVLQNLLENAIKYTMDGGNVTIDIINHEDKLEVVISDNGIGIPKDQQKNIFNRFFRASNAVKRETDGSGLGLYIAKTIVEKNSGQIWFESEENIGTTFHFTVPLSINTKDQVKENK